MLTVKDACNLIESNHKPYKVVWLGETEELFILSLNNDDEGYETVDKHTGKTGFMWIWDFADLVDDGKVKERDIKESETRRNAS